MKTKWEVWAHLITVRYSYSALRKITKWLRKKEIIDLLPTDVYKYTTSEKKSMGDFIDWFKNGEFRCIAYNNMPKDLEEEYEFALFQAKRKIRRDMLDKVLKEL